MRVRADPLAASTAVDVAIVGGGFTGLWTAYYLRRRDPTLRIVVLERHRVGFGASGRNGGWCSALFPVPLDRLAARHGAGAATRMQRALHDTVTEVVRVCAAEGIEADVAHAGSVDLVRNRAQLRRARTLVDRARTFGFGDDDLRLVGPAEARDVVAASRVLAAVVTPHCATVHPARLVHGVAAAAVRAGVSLHHDTRVLDIAPGRVVTDRGEVRAEVVVRATEAYGAELPGLRRDVLPLYSLMVATEPLPPGVLDAVGLHERPTFADLRRGVIYGQRTADGRIAFGGRGAPYHLGSSIAQRHDTDRRVRDRLTATLRDLLPALGDARVEHHWGGPLGVPRDLHPGVRYDRASGLATAGGYVGDGVAAANLAGRTLADLVTGTDSDLVRLPWVGHRSRRWEPEPARWLGVNTVRVLADVADRIDDARDAMAGRRRPTG